MPNSSTITTTLHDATNRTRVSTGYHMEGDCVASRKEAQETCTDSKDADREETRSGKPFVATLNRRDFTIKPQRQAPLPPSVSVEPESLTKAVGHSVPFPSQAAPPPLSPSKAPSSSTPRRTKSTSSVSHPPVSPPQYTVRSQPIGLSRSNSFSEIAPTISGGLTRRLSVSSFSSEDDHDPEEEQQMSDSKPMNRPLFKHRSESLPRFPPIQLSGDEKTSKKPFDEEELAKLPSNPKMWLPSHLALYLSNVLSLHPTLAEDITAFIRNSRLSGRTFLRLKSTDLEELGVNVRWRAALLEAGDKLRRESLGGRIFWGYEGGRHNEEGDRLEIRSATIASSSIGLSYPSSLTLPNSHRRRPSLEVEGSASEDESSKEEWKRSWRRLNRGNNRVKGLAKTFETVIETSERSINVTPATSPIKNRTDSYKRSKIRSHVEGGGGAEGFARTRSDSIDSNLSAASIDSFSGRYGDSSKAAHSSPSIAASSSESPSFVPTVSSPDLESSATRQSPVTPVKKDTLSDHRVSFATEYDWRLYPDSPGFRRRRATADDEPKAEGVNEDEEEEEEKTLKPVRAASSGGGSVATYALSPVSTEKRAGLADLFGLELPKAKRETKKKFDVEDEMVEMLVPGVDETGKGGRKSSMVLIKKSQFAALQHRMEEVEAQVALALESNGFQSPRKDYSDKENEVDQLEGRLIGLEHQTRLLASISPNSSPLKDRNYHSPLCPTRSRSTVASEDTFAQDESKAWWAEEASPLGWKALGGYVVAASIGIGIVAGEVVAAKLLGIRRR
ncbi:hypothetical protein JCM5350_007496 [Sporobolomyces pararoseus]